MEDQPLQESAYKKVIVLIMSIFLLVLILSYFLISPEINDIIASLIESNKVEEYILDDGEVKLIFSKDVYDDLQNLYFNNQSVEFKTCLSGIKNDNIYNLTLNSQPRIIQQTFNSVISEPCPTNTLVDLHSHPYARCLASQQDIKSFQVFKASNDNAIMVIMCKPDRFSIYK